MFNNYAKNMSKNIYESKHGTGFKILSHKLMLQRLTIALHKQIVYSLYQSKKNYHKSI